MEACQAHTLEVGGSSPSPAISILIQYKNRTFVLSMKDNFMDKTYFLIYKITNLINGMIYIGRHKTKNKDDDYMGSGIWLKKSQEKYGLDKFKKEIIFECQSEEDMIKLESEIVDELFVSRIDTYNLIVGGLRDGWNYVNKNKLNNKSNQYLMTWDRCKKDPEYFEFLKQKISNSVKLSITINGHNWIGRKHKQEAKDKIGKANSISQKGKNNSRYGTCWIYNEEIKKSKSIHKNELEIFLSTGWKIGRKIKWI